MCVQCCSTNRLFCLCSPLTRRFFFVDLGLANYWPYTNEGRVRLAIYRPLIKFSYDIIYIKYHCDQLLCAWAKRPAQAYRVLTKCLVSMITNSMPGAPDSNQTSQAQQSTYPTQLALYDVSNIQPQTQTLMQQHKVSI